MMATTSPLLRVMKMTTASMKYGKDGDIPDEDNEYAVGVDGVGKPLDEGDDQRYPRTRVPCESAAERALTLRASYSQWAALRV